MAITNGYCSLADIKGYLNITSTNTADDTVLENLVTSASRFIDSHTRRTFYARTETRYYSLPEFDTLWIDDDDLLTITTLTNGDGTTIASTAYTLTPANSTPKYAIKLKTSSGIYWQPASTGEITDIIGIAGTWGYSSTTPADIQQACLEIVSNEYRKRNGQNESSSATITAAGVVLSPVGIPSSAREILNSYRRLI